MALNDTEALFEHWKSVMGHTRARMDLARKKIIQARMGDGYTLEDLMMAVDGCASSAFHMGENDRGQRYDSLTLIFRDADHVDKFIRAGEFAHRIAAQRVAKEESTVYVAMNTQSAATEEQKQKVRAMLASVKLKKVV